MSVSTQTRAPARDPAALLWTVAATCWTATVVVISLGGAKLASHDWVIEHSTLPWVLRIAAFTLIWTVMVGAMMLPTTVPMARLVVAVSARAPDPRATRVALACSYLAVWVAFGLVALVGDRGIHAVVDNWPWLNRHSELVLASLLGLTGVVQFSRLKDRCLTACRDPLRLLWQHYGRGPRPAWRLGWHHALNCVGCCWALMLVMFGVGTADLRWMLALTAVMVGEKLAPWGKRIATPVGVGLVAFAAALALAGFGIAPFAPALSMGYG